MFKEKKTGGQVLGGGNQTIIAQGVRVEGDFRSNGDVVIDGEVAGSVETSQSLQIGESARIEANIVAKSAVIAGEVRGNIVASDRLELTATSSVHGDIETGLISVAAGAQVNGKITMGTVKKATKEVVEEEEDSDKE